MGAAGLTCSTCEMGARGGVGLEVELDRVPQRETGMTAYEIMLSESQERMLLVAEKGREDEVLQVFAKWGLDAVIVRHGDWRSPAAHSASWRAGRRHSQPVADRRCAAVSPPGRRVEGAGSADPPAEVLAELKKPRDYTADLKKLLASSNICSKRWVYEQYDTMVQTNTVQGPGRRSGRDAHQGDRHRGHERGLAMALDGNGRWCYLDPKLGAMLAVAEAARKVAVYRRDSRGSNELPELRQSGKAGDHGAVFGCHRRHCRGLHRAGHADYGRQRLAYITRREARESIQLR